MLPTMFSSVNFVGSWAAIKLAGRPGRPVFLSVKTRKRKNVRLFRAAGPGAVDFRQRPLGAAKCPPGADFSRPRPNPRADRFAGRRCRGARVRPIRFGNRMPNAGVLPSTREKNQIHLTRFLPIAAVFKFFSALWRFNAVESRNWRDSQPSARQWGG